MGKPYEEMSHEDRALLRSHLQQPHRKLDAAIKARDAKLPQLAEPGADWRELSTVVDEDKIRRAQLKNDLSSAVEILQTDPTLSEMVWYDEFSRRSMTGKPPRYWTDGDDSLLALYIQRCWRVQMKTATVAEAVTVIARQNRKHPVRDWLDGLLWDGRPRLDNFFEKYFGVVDSPYTRAAGGNFLKSMIARVYKPGCQADHMIILEGEQGKKKSSALRILGEPWFIELHERVASKDFKEALQGQWLIEIAEMDAFKGADMSRVKAEITNLDDYYRETYGRRAQSHPRQCVFAGTTNKQDWPRDETGARRFWPIACGRIELDVLRVDRDQLFAEALVRYRNGERWWEMPELDTAEEQRKRFHADPWLQPISEYIDNEDRRRTGVVVNDILTEQFEFKLGHITRADEMRVTECLKFLGWEKKPGRVDGRVRQVWRPK